MEKAVELTWMVMSVHGVMKITKYCHTDGLRAALHAGRLQFVRK